MKIQEMVDKVQSGQIQLPNFQRAYVWQPHAAELLFDSLYHDYPISDIITWPQENGIELIIDGQQRISSLYAGFTDEIPPTCKDQAKQPKTGLHFNVETQQFKFSIRRERDPKFWVPVSPILTKKDGALDPVPSADPNHMRRALRLESLADRDLIVSRIPKDSDADTALKIFERLNKQGVNVKRADLEMALICVKWEDGKATITQETNHWRNGIFGTAMDHAAVIRTMSVLHTGRYDSKGFGPVTAKDLQTAFNNTKEANAELAKILENRLNIRENKIITSVSTFPVIARFLWKHGNRFPTEADKAKAIDYLLTTMSWGIHQGATESKINQDLTALNNSSPWENLQDANRRLHGVLRADAANFEFTRSGGRFKLLYHIISQLPQIKDWHTDKPIFRHPWSELNQHHIFPRAQLMEHYPRDQADQIANLTLLSTETNQSISDRMPANYLPAIDDRDSSLLTSHYIPRDRELWKIENYPAFLQKRRELMADAANHLLDDLKAGILP